MPAFTYRFPIRFADVDHAGIVYFPRFFHYFHVAFEELWRARVGARAYRELLDQDRVGFPAVRAECDFRAPLRFGEDAEVALTVARLGTSSIAFHYVVSRVTDSAPEVCADGRVVCAVVDLARFVAVPVVRAHRRAARRPRRAVARGTKPHNLPFTPPTSPE